MIAHAALGHRRRMDSIHHRRRIETIHPRHRHRDPEHKSRGGGGGISEVATHAVSSLDLRPRRDERPHNPHPPRLRRGVERRPAVALRRRDDRNRGGVCRCCARVQLLYPFEVVLTAESKQLSLSSLQMLFVWKECNG